jgi:hypothetical protein
MGGLEGSVTGGCVGTVGIAEGAVGMVASWVVGIWVGWITAVAGAKAVVPVLGSVCRLVGREERSMDIG